MTALIDEIRHAAQDAMHSALHAAGRQIALSVTVAVLAGLALIFAALGLFMALAPTYGPAVAAFVTAGAAAALALLGLVRMRATFDSKGPQPRRQTAPPPEAPDSPAGAESLAVVAIAGLAAGFLSGRGDRYPDPSGKD